MTEHRVFLVLGVPRSGTSLTAHLLHELGVPMGERFKVNAEWCRDGLWEDEEIEAALARVTNEAGCDIRQGKIAACKDDRPVEALRALIRKRKERPKWGIKSPLMTILLQQFEEWCLPHRLSLILCEREFRECVASYAKRMKMALPKAAPELSWTLFLTQEFFHRHAGPKLRVDYRDMLADPRCQIKRLAEFAGEPFREEVLGIVDRGQKRF